MQRRSLAVLTLIALLPAGAVSDSDVRHSIKNLADQCLGIYADELPRDVRVRHVGRDGSSLIVYAYRLDWTGAIQCALYRDGSLDEIETLNRRFDVLWTEPPMPANPRAGVRRTGAGTGEKRGSLGRSLVTRCGFFDARSLSSAKDGNRPKADQNRSVRTLV